MEAFFDNVTMLLVFIIVFGFSLFMGEFITTHVLDPWSRRRRLLKQNKLRRMMNSEYESLTGLHGATPWPIPTEEEAKQAIDRYRKRFPYISANWDSDRYRKGGMTPDEEFEETTRRG